MFTTASLQSNQTVAETAVVRGLRVVAWDDLRAGGRTKPDFRHFPNSPELGSEAER